jgi:hypothetical protein
MRPHFIVWYRAINFTGSALLRMVMSFPVDGGSCGTVQLAVLLLPMCLKLNWI